MADAQSYVKLRIDAILAVGWIDSAVNVKENDFVSGSGFNIGRTTIDTTTWLERNTAHQYTSGQNKKKKLQRKSAYKS